MEIYNIKTLDVIQEALENLLDHHKGKVKTIDVSCEFTLSCHLAKQSTIVETLKEIKGQNNRLHLQAMRDSSSKK